MLAPKRLLLATGDKPLSRTLTVFFENCGYQVETAQDGLECLLKLRQAVPSAVVLDLELLWGGGTGVLAHMREEPSLRLIPVVLVAPREGGSGSNQPAPPVVGFLHKPLRVLELIRQVQEAVASG
jgi:CheY-like chemotaxis protein